MKSMGLKVGTWTFLGTQPEQDARIASDLLNRYDLDLYIADVEQHHKEDTYGDSNRSERFVNTFRSLQPDAPLGWSTYAAGMLLGSTKDSEAGPMDYEAPYKAGAVLMPQVFPGEYGDIYSLDNTIAHAKRAGWDLSRVKPTFGFYRGETPEKDFANFGDRYGIDGYSLFRIPPDSSYYRRIEQMQ
jgi:hypothetical protein